MEEKLIKFIEDNYNDIVAGEPQVVNFIGKMGEDSYLFATVDPNYILQLSYSEMMELYE